MPKVHTITDDYYAIMQTCKEGNGLDNKIAESVSKHSNNVCLSYMYVLTC